MIDAELVAERLRGRALDYQAAESELTGEPATTGLPSGLLALALFEVAEALDPALDTEDAAA